MKTIFSQIISKELNAHIVAEDDNNMAFLDISPIKKGHTLVIPKKGNSIDYLFDLPEADFINLHLFSKKVAIAIKKAIKCKKIGSSVLGLEIPHAHIHLIPIDNISDMNFTKNKIKISYDEMLQTAKDIKFAYDLLNS